MNLDRATPFSLRVLQIEHARWELKNFGIQPQHRPVLGIVEELGELSEALDASMLPTGERPDVDPLIRDAIADTVIYMASLANILGCDLCAVLDSNTFAKPRSLERLSGRLAHHCLKKEQKIRGTAEEHDDATKLLLGELYIELRNTALTYLDENILGIVEMTWNKVRLRDWNKDPKFGGESSS